jgi:chitin disaccharide deacetylase
LRGCDSVTLAFIIKIMSRTLFIAAVAVMVTYGVQSQDKETYAEKLGWNKGDRVLILHIDDAGMSHESNAGTIRALEDGAANSVSVMMTCPWVPGFVKYLKENPEVDAGLHLTMTSEWEDYRWGPLVGKPAAPGLVDEEGAMWRNKRLLKENASADEVEMEIRAQIERAREMGFEPTHLDSHMGALFSSPKFIKKYVELGIEYQIPIMLPGGHSTALSKQLKDEGSKSVFSVPVEVRMARMVGKRVWNKGLPVLDDLHSVSYGWKLPEGVEATDENLQKMKTERYMEDLRDLKPGVTMVIMHCTDTSEHFDKISASGDSRKGDLLAMIDPEFKKFIEEEGLILTTWRELKERRDRVE